MKLNKSDFEKIAHYEKRRGIEYARVGGKLYNRLFVFGFLAWLYMMFMSLLYILGTLLNISAERGKWENTFIAIFAAFAVTLASLVFYCCKMKLTALFMNIAAVIVMAAGFIKITGVNATSNSSVSEYDPGFLGLKKIFYLRHGIPMLIVLAVCVFLSVIVIRERIIIKKEFNKISENEYEPQIISDDA